MIDPHKFDALVWAMILACILFWFLVARAFYWWLQ
jgi:hypothetical protein